GRIPVAAPLGHVAGHVVEAFRRAAETPARTDRLRRGRPEDGVSGLRRIPPPGEGPALLPERRLLAGAARGVLPLRFGREARAEPRRVRLRLVPGHAAHRRVFSILRDGMAGIEAAVLAVGDLVTLDPKRLHRHAMRLAILARQLEFGAHAELTTRQRHPVV